MKKLAFRVILMLAASASWANNFTVASSGAHTLALTNVSNPGDNTSFVDDVSISATASPEPATFVLIGGGLLGLGLVRRRRA
jgi:hypothetical protein